MFKFYINKIESFEIIKFLCQNYLSVPIMFDCLLDINSDKIKDLIFDDITKNLSFDNNFLNLIKDYQKNKCFFKNG